MTDTELLERPYAALEALASEDDEAVQDLLEEAAEHLVMRSRNRIGGASMKNCRTRTLSNGSWSKRTTRRLGVASSSSCMPANCSKSTPVAAHQSKPRPPRTRCRCPFLPNPGGRPLAKMAARVKPG